MKEKGREKIEEKSGRNVEKWKGEGKREIEEVVEVLRKREREEEKDEGKKKKKGRVERKGKKSEG